MTHKECLVSWIVVRDDPKLLDDSGTVPKTNKMVGGSIPDHEIVCILNKKTSQVVKCLLCSKKNTKISWIEVETRKAKS